MRNVGSGDGWTAASVDDINICGRHHKCQKCGGHRSGSFSLCTCADGRDSEKAAVTWFSMIAGGTRYSPTIQFLRNPNSTALPAAISYKTSVKCEGFQIAIDHRQCSDLDSISAQKCATFCLQHQGCPSAYRRLQSMDHPLQGRYMPQEDTWHLPIKVQFSNEMALKKPCLRTSSRCQ